MSLLRKISLPYVMIPCRFKFIHLQRLRRRLSLLMEGIEPIWLTRQRTSFVAHPRDMILL